MRRRFALYAPTHVIELRWHCERTRTRMQTELKCGSSSAMADLQ